MPPAPPPPPPSNHILMEAQEGKYSQELYIPVSFHNFPRIVSRPMLSAGNSHQRYPADHSYVICLLATKLFIVIVHTRFYVHLLQRRGHHASKEQQGHLQPLQFTHWPWLGMKAHHNLQWGPPGYLASSPCGLCFPTSQSSTLEYIQQQRITINFMVEYTEDKLKIV